MLFALRCAYELRIFKAFLETITKTKFLLFSYFIVKKEVSQINIPYPVYILSLTYVNILDVILPFKCNRYMIAMTYLFTLVLM